MSDRRLKQVFAGKSVSSVVSGQSTQRQPVEGLQRTNQVELKPRKLPKKLLAERRKPLKDKLKFYEETMQDFERKIETDHVPWWQPRTGSLPGTPPNCLAKVDLREPEKAVRSSAPATPRQVQSQQNKYALNPQFLGRRGNRILTDIVRDERLNIAPTERELRELGEIMQMNVAREPKRQDSTEELLERIMLGGNAEQKFSKEIVAKFFKESK
jgi:hypothetical protein